MSSARFSGGPVLVLAAAFTAALLGTSLHPAYGYFLDEFEYLAASQRLAFGYVDYPPLAVWLLAGCRGLLGDSLPAVRLLPALCGGATVWLAARVAFRLGGDRFAQLLAGLCVCTSTLLFTVFSFFSTNSFEILLWTATLAMLLELCRSGDERQWLAVGLLLGCTAMIKHTGLVLAGAIAIGLVLSPLRRHMRGRSLWLGVGAALLILLPNLAWQLEHDWISVEYYASQEREANVGTSPLRVLADQIGSFNPLTFPVWLAGLGFFWLSAAGRRIPVVGWAVAVLWVALLASGRSRPDRIMGVYPFLFGVGAATLEAAIARPGLRWLRVALPVAIVSMGVLSALLVVPVLPPEPAARLVSALGEENEIQREVETAPLLLPLAHRLGSEEVVAEVEAAVARLEPEELDGAVILAESFSPAGALELLGSPDLPPVFSAHNAYFLWGPPPTEPRLVVAVGFEMAQLTPYFARVELAANATCSNCMGWRQETPIALAREPRRPLSEAWPELRRLGLSARKLFLLDEATPTGDENDAGASVPEP